MEGRRWLREVMGLNVTNVANEQIHSAAIEYSSFSIICEAQSRKKLWSACLYNRKIEISTHGLTSLLRNEFLAIKGLFRGNE